MGALGRRGFGYRGCRRWLGAGKNESEDNDPDGCGRHNEPMPPENHLALADGFLEESIGKIGAEKCQAQSDRVVFYKEKNRPVVDVRAVRDPSEPSKHLPGEENPYGAARLDRGGDDGQ